MSDLEEVDLAAIELIASQVKPVQHIEVAEAEEDFRRELHDSQVEQAEKWFKGAPLFITRIGSWVIRVSDSQAEADRVAQGILDTLNAYDLLRLQALRLVKLLRAERSRTVQLVLEAGRLERLVAELQAKERT